jgi:hypothetical protein
MGVAAVAFAIATALQTAETSAITYGEPDCEDIANTGCEHPN